MNPVFALLVLGGIWVSVVFFAHLMLDVDTKAEQWTIHIIACVVGIVVLIQSGKDPDFSASNSTPTAQNDSIPIENEPPPVRNKPTPNPVTPAVVANTPQSTPKRESLRYNCDGYEWNKATSLQKEVFCQVAVLEYKKRYPRVSVQYFQDALNAFYNSTDPYILQQKANTITRMSAAVADQQ